MCAFCGLSLDTHASGALWMAVGSERGGGSQGFSVHATCIAERLHPEVPFDGDFGPSVLCPDCREPVDSTDPASTYAIQLVDRTDPTVANYLPTNAKATESSDSVESVVYDEGYFHPGCSPAAIGWETKPRPS